MKTIFIFICLFGIINAFAIDQNDYNQVDQLQENGLAQSNLQQSEPSESIINLNQRRGEIRGKYPSPMVQNELYRFGASNSHGLSQPTSFNQPRFVPTRNTSNRRQYQFDRGNNDEDDDDDDFQDDDDEYECGKLRPQLSNYVANGKSTHHRLWPWHIQLTIIGIAQDETYCGATLICRNYILTAAHCFDDIEKHKRAKSTRISLKGVDIGSHKTNRNRKFSKDDPNTVSATALEVILHPEYAPAGMSEQEARRRNTKPGPRHDLALIKFEVDDEDILSRLMPICLPSEGYQMNVGTRCRIMGHGFMNSRDEENFIMPHLLQMADVHISSNTACRNDVDSEAIRSKINADTLCVRGPIHPCVGDSGGPLLCQGRAENDISGHMHNDHVDPKDRWYLMGVTSFAVSTDDDDKCGKFKSAVFGRVSNYIKWIKWVTKNCHKRR